MAKNRFKNRFLVIQIINRRLRGRPRQQWVDRINNDTEDLGNTVNNEETKGHDRWWDLMEVAKNFMAFKEKK